MKWKETYGFTLVEIIIVIAIIAVIATISTISFQNMKNAAALRIGTQEVHTLLIDARNNTVSAKGNITYGVRISSTTVTLFEGGAYSASDPNNVAYAFEGGVSATSSLVTGNTDIVFKKLTGEPSATGTIFLRNLGNTSTKTVTVHGSGLIES